MRRPVPPWFIYATGGKITRTDDMDQVAVMGRRMKYFGVICLCCVLMGAIGLAFFAQNLADEKFKANHDLENDVSMYQNNQNPSDSEGGFNSVSTTVDVSSTEELTTLYDKVAFTGVAADRDAIYVIAKAHNETYLGYGEWRRDWDSMLMKFDSDGNLIWKRIMGGPSLDLFAKVAVLNDSIYVGGHYREDWDSSVDGLLVKYNINGSLLWKRTWGGFNSDSFSGVAADDDHIYVSGRTACYRASGYDGLLMMFNSSGDLIWNQTWQVSSQSSFTGISMDGNSIYLSGSVDGGGQDVLLVKYNYSGFEIWNRTWGGLRDDHIYDLEVEDGFIYLAGFAAGNALLMQYDSSGTLLWNRTWGGNRGGSFRGIAVDGNDIYVGGSITYVDWGGDGYVNAVVVKYNASGDLLWNQTWQVNSQSAFAGIAISNGFIYGAGETFQTAVLAKYNYIGNLIWVQVLGVAPEGIDPLIIFLIIGAVATVTSVIVIKKRHLIMGKIKASPKGGRLAEKHPLPQNLRKYRGIAYMRPTDGEDQLDLEQLIGQLPLAEAEQVRQRLPLIDEEYQELAIAFELLPPEERLPMLKYIFKHIPSNDTWEHVDQLIEEIEGLERDGKLAEAIGKLEKAIQLTEYLGDQKLFRNLTLHYHEIRAIEKFGEERMELESIPSLSHSVNHTLQTMFKTFFESCRICQRGLPEDHEYVVCQGCFAKFHRDCILRMLEQDKTCPACQKEWTGWI